MREQQDGLFGMIDEAVREIWLIVQDQGDVVCARDVFSGDDDKLVPGNVAFEGDVRDLSARDWTANRCAVKHLRERQIIDVQRLAGDFLRPSLRGTGLPM